MTGITSVKRFKEAITRYYGPMFRPAEPTLNKKVTDVIRKWKGLKYIKDGG